MESNPQAASWYRASSHDAHWRRVSLLFVLPCAHVLKKVLLLSDINGSGHANDAAAQFLFLLEMHGAAELSFCLVINLLRLTQACDIC